LFLSLLSFGIALKPRKVLNSWILTGMALLVVVIITDTTKTLWQYQQRNFTVYNVNYKKRLIDFFDGAACVSLSDTLTDRQQRYAALSNRWANGIREILDHHLNENPVRESNMMYAPPFIQYYQHRVVIVDNASTWTSIHPEAQGSNIKVNTMIISKNPRIEPKRCLQFFCPETVIIDATNGKKKRREWIDECIIQKVPYHDIKEQGSITIKV
ncbi:MAG TPA: hypothetical protein PK858_03780, partial [Saprospiraceae bacterium]|nr:hypothetical protein [Saprospiraceae bacterium]